MGAGVPWWESSQVSDEEDSTLLAGLCDAVALYASGTGLCGESLPEDVVAPDSLLSSWHRSPLGHRASGSHARQFSGAAPGEGSSSLAGGSSPESVSSTDGVLTTASAASTTLTVAPLLTAPPSPENMGQRWPTKQRAGGACVLPCGGAIALGSVGSLAAPTHSGSSGSNCARSCGGLGQGGARWRSGGEPLLRSLTQLTNAAAANASARRQIITQCQVHVSLLRLMQGPWARQRLVAERCCRLVHWLCTRTPENREILAAHRSLCISGGARSFSFVDAALGVAELHLGCRAVLAHALRALAALLPCPQVREELSRSQPRLLSCLVHAGEALDACAVRSVCRWLPGMSGQIRQARSLLARNNGSSFGVFAASSGHQIATEVAACDDDDDVDMMDL